jgi:lipid A 3-O-deacylase
MPKSSNVLKQPFPEKGPKGKEDKAVSLRFLFFMLFFLICLPSTGFPENHEKGKTAISEIRLGALGHDVGLLGHKIEHGKDFNLEMLFHTPNLPLFRKIWSPKPHLGFTFNEGGGTSQLYAGLSWIYEMGPLFFEGSLGLAVHNGGTSNMKGPRKAFGQRWLFRESLQMGYRLGGSHSLSLMLDHVSNAGLSTANPGMETFGLRYGFAF